MRNTLKTLLLAVLFISTQASTTLPKEFSIAGKWVGTAGSSSFHLSGNRQIEVIKMQVDTFDVFIYPALPLFTKNELPSRLQFNLSNNDTSFCAITLYKSQPAKANVMKDVISQWNERVVKRLTKANKKPAKIMTEQLWDGWVSTLAIGNFYQNNKKCVVMLHSFRKDTLTACAVFEMSDRIFKGPVEAFSKNLHLKNKQ